MKNILDMRAPSRTGPYPDCFFSRSESYELENNKTEEKNLCICLNM